MKTYFFHNCIVICLLALPLSQAKATVIFSDGFETPTVSGFDGGSFSPGWTLNEPSDPNQLGLRNIGISYEGSQLAQINAFNTLVGSSFSRSIATNIGQIYNFSLWYYSYVGVDGAVRADFGSSTLSSSPVLANDTWYELVFNHTATSTSTLLTITDITTNTNSSDLFLDKVTISSVPEPSMLGLFGLGTSAMLLRRNRKKQI